ncbi:hypothetical protein AMC79_CH01840 [Rhizobium phaseoli]|nr:hypothetical protein AMC89_CH01845 [Rhizobium phaseoli]ANL97643.1 hypothetical protein AMC79_CH01840 [Rhizobium phaseoli]
MGRILEAHLVVMDSTTKMACSVVFAAFDRKTAASSAAGRSHCDRLHEGRNAARPGAFKSPRQVPKPAASFRPGREASRRHALLFEALPTEDEPRNPKIPNSEHRQGTRLISLKCRRRSIVTISRSDTRSRHERRRPATVFDDDMMGSPAAERNGFGAGKVPVCYRCGRRAVKDQDSCGLCKECISP